MRWLLTEPAIRPTWGSSTSLIGLTLAGSKAVTGMSSLAKDLADYAESFSFSFLI